MSEHVILLHGLWMRGFTLVALRRRMEKAGFSVDLFDYASVMHDPAASIAQLLERARRAKAQKIHFVGHSLGGLIALQALQEAPDLPAGKVVCLGSPLRGSAVARSIAQWPGGNWIIGKSLDMLRDGIDDWRGARPLGSVAGRLPIGLGSIIGNLPSPHDGTVAVAETQVQGLTDHCIVPATHTGLLFSDEAAAQTVSFLRAAHFTRAS